MINALFRRYKIFFIIGIAILLIQFYLAYKSFKIPINSKPPASTKSSSSSKSAKHEPRRSNEKSAIPLSDDEDIINSNIQQDAAHKVNEKSSSSSSASSSLLNELRFKPKCDILGDKEVASAVQRASSQSCKQHIIDIACQIKSGTFYPKTLPNTCPSGNYIANRLLGCFQDEKQQRLLPSFYSNFKETNSPKKCIQICLQSGYLYAGVQYSSECFCGNREPPQSSRLPDPNCNMKCPAESKSACGGYFTMNIYETGIAKFSSQIAEAPKTGDEKVKIVFLLTLNGRALRQVHRLLKALYSVDHFYYIHIDARQDYFYRELLKLESMFPNVRLTRKRFSTIWGGASLLEMLLSCMQELLEIGWTWDFVLNLSESDYPIKTLDKLEEFLGANREKNFVKSHGREAQRFIQKQGLDKTFIECDTHMWRIGERVLPSGISIDGGSDWVCLARPFVEFVTQEQSNPLVEGLLRIFSHTLLPAESFFHTAIRNSVFCNTYIDNNLHITNWKRKMGCKCQYKAIVDWCGCSPNDFKPDDWHRLQATESKQLFFGRKFEPVISQKIVLQLEEKLFGPYPQDYVNLNSFWQSTYHHKDKSPKPKVELLNIAESLIRINSKSNSVQFYKPLEIREITDYFENDVYKGFLIRHQAKIHVNLTVELETLCQPYHNYAQVSKSHRLAKKVMQLDVSTDADQKELISRNFARVIGENSEPVLILKLLGSTQVGNNSETFNVVWIDPSDRVKESQNLTIDDITVTTVNFLKSTMPPPLQSGVWTLKIFQKKALVGLTKFLIAPSTVISEEGTKESNSSLNNLDKMISNFYQIKETCISFNHKNIRELIGSYLGTNELNDNIHKFNECKKSLWSSFSPDPKSELINEPGFFDGSS